MEARRVLREARAEAVIERQHLMLLCLLPPAADHIGKAHGLLACEIVSLREILREMKQFPFVVLERRARRMIGDRLPAAMPEAAMAEHLEILRRGLRERRRIDDRAGETLAFERHLRTARDRGGRIDADEVEQCRHEVAGMNELMAQLAARRDPFRP